MASLNQHRRRPTLAVFDMSKSALPDIMSNYKLLEPFLIENGGSRSAQPEVEALSFYLTNAVYAEIVRRKAPGEDLGNLEWAVEKYHDVLRPLGVRMFYYLLFICTREARHCTFTSSFRHKFKSDHGEKIYNFLYQLRGESSSTVVSRLSKYPPDVLMGPYADALVAIYKSGGFPSSNFGGKKWCEVAMVLREFVYGKISTEMMVDTAFTLAHNNGPIFNKGILFLQYNIGEIMKILDVQRAGMIPSLVFERASEYVEDHHREFLAKVGNELVEEGSPFGHKMVNWPLVEKFSVKGPDKQKKEYYIEKNKQQKTNIAKLTAKLALAGTATGSSSPVTFAVPFGEAHEVEKKVRNG